MAPSLLARLRRDTRANVSLMFGLAIVPLILAAGAAIDYSNAVRGRQALQQASDAAALAAARFDGTTAQRKAVAQKYFDSNLGPYATGYGATMSFTDTDKTVGITASLTVPTYFMQIAGYKSTTASITSEVTKEANGLEVVLVFDNTGSMTTNSRLTTLVAASKTFTDILFGARTSANTLKIGLVPFSAAVNVGPANSNKFWLDKTGATSISKLNFNTAGWNNWKAWQTITNRSWNGCVEARAGSLAFDDTPPSAGTPETLFAPYFAPDEPGSATTSSITLKNASNQNQTYYNSWRTDVPNTGTDMDSRQRTPGKYTNGTLSSSYAGPEFNCQIAPITPLTGDKATIVSGINAMVANGATVIPEGLAWGLRVLSPEEPFTEGVAFSNNQNIKKALILLTDGENDVGSGGSPLPNHNGVWYNTFGYLPQNRLGTTNFTTFHSTLDAKTQQVCNLIKSKGVVVYSFSYGVTNTNAKNLIKSCATDAAKYFDPPSNAALAANFTQIANELRNLYLSK
ncbi:MAG: TadE/TadG family type IV pilus assembly protein [Hyphomicrobiales bacterium]